MRSPHYVLKVECWMLHCLAPHQPTEVWPSIILYNTLHSGSQPPQDYITLGVNGRWRWIQAQGVLTPVIDLKKREKKKLFPNGSLARRDWRDMKTQHHQRRRQHAQVELLEAIKESRAEEKIVKTSLHHSLISHQLLTKPPASLETKISRPSGGNNRRESRKLLSIIQCFKWWDKEYHHDESIISAR